MEKPSRAEFTTMDFAGWQESSTLVLSPKFQRRGVWKTPARAFLIDTLLRGYPVPPIYVRTAQSSDKKKVIREVIDGQQRIASVLDFMAGKYRLSKTLKQTWANKTFPQLPETEQDRIRTYVFATEVFQGIGDPEVLELFARLNTYSVPLNKQELRNGQYFGAFKQLAYLLARQRLEFWRRHKAFTEQNIARMLEVEFVSEVLIAQIAGMQDKKKSIDSFYEKYDDEIPHAAQVEKRFNDVVNVIDGVIADGLTDSEFRRSPLLYTLYCVVYHRLFGLPGQTLSTPKKAMSASDLLDLAEALERSSAVIALARGQQEVPKRYEKFVVACLRQTDNIKPRAERFKFLYNEAFSL
jgi:hypothetical protein